MAVSVQPSVHLPHVSIAAVAAANSSQELLHLGPNGSGPLPLAVRQVLNHSLAQDLEDLSQEEELGPRTQHILQLSPQSLA